MSANENNPNIKFGTVQGDVVMGDQHKGDIVHGNKDSSQGATNIGGDMHGNINQMFANASNPVEFVDALEAAFNRCFHPDNSVAEPAIPEKDNVTDTPELDDVSHAAYEAPDAVFDDMRTVAMSATPEKDAVPSVLSRFTRLVANHGATVGKAMCAGVVAGLQATVASNPLVAATVGFLATFKEA